MKQILIVGLGNIGKRYLEGVALVADVKVIHLLDPNLKAIDCAKMMVSSDIEITEVTTGALSPSYDLCIVATSSSPRTTIVEKISDKTHVRAWILEKILAQSPEQLERIRAAVGHNLAWVNTPRRLTSIYKNMRRIIGQKKIFFSVRQSEFALACNSIHFIDTVSWLTGETITDVDLQSVSGWYDAKREGYKEFDGTLTATFSLGSVLEISNTEGIKNPGLRISSLDREKEFEIEINEAEGFTISGQFYKGRVEYQSELTPGVIRSVLERGVASIPTLNDSIIQHMIFLNAFKNNEQLALACKDTVPIT